MEKPILYYADQRLPRVVYPQNGKDFQLPELYKMLECETIEVVSAGPRKLMIIDEEGKLKAKNVNVEATILFVQSHRMSGDCIVGNALVCPNNYLK